MSFADQVRALIEDQGATAVERGLIDDDVHEMSQLDGVGANEVWRVELGTQGEAGFFKPVNGVNQTTAYLFGHTRESVFLSEVAAYRLAHAIGAPYDAIVPACVIRRIPKIDPHAPGSLAVERYADRDIEIFQRAPALVLQAAFVDALIGNQDRSIANFLFDSQRGDLALIDHGFAFPRDGDLCNASLFLGWRREAGVLALTDVEKGALEHLLGDDDLLGLRRYLAPDRYQPVAARARRMLETGQIV